jgi:Flp pilus assembly pilin Flp
MEKRQVRSESGQAIVEYALIAAVLLVSLYGAAMGLMHLQGQFTQHQSQALLNWRSP